MPSRKVGKVVEPLQAPFEEIENWLINSEPHSKIIPFPNEFPRSPLRYPGGKNRAVRSIYACIPANETILCSPFLGGASIELACSTRMKVYGSDIFEPLIAFWRNILTNPELLAERVECYYPLSRTDFYDLQKSYIQLTDEMERAAAFFVLNRCSYSGTTLSGGMSPGHPRFNESAIQRVRSFKAENFKVECADFRDMIPKHENAFLYLDPPYMIEQALYGVKGDTHKDFDHRALAEILEKRDRWIMSYNDSSEIRKLYGKHPIRTIEWVYGMSKNKQSKEVLILSRDLA